MSFSLYGAVATWSMTKWGNYVPIALAGDKLLIHYDDIGRTSLYDFSFNEVAQVCSTTSPEKNRYLAVHRLGRLPELYGGVGLYSGMRCTTPLGICTAEIERYTYGSNSVDAVCTGDDCIEGSPGEVYYDAKANKLVVSTEVGGNKLYLVDPDTGEVKKWLSRDAGADTHYSTKVFVHDDNNVYVVISRYKPTYMLEIRRFKTSEFYDVFGTGVIEDYGELVYREDPAQRIAPEKKMLTFAPSKPVALLESITGTAGVFPCYGYDPVGNRIVEEYPFCPSKRYFGNYAVDYDGETLVVYDIGSNAIAEKIANPEGKSVAYGAWLQYTDPIFAVYNDNANVYIYLLTYVGVAPVLEYDHVNRRIRIVDFITKYPLVGELWVWRSRFCYPRDAYPTGIAPEVLETPMPESPDAPLEEIGWIPVPNAYKDECLTFAIKSVWVG